MEPSRWQFDHNPWYGWGVSSVLHLLLVIIVSLMLMPSGDGSSDLLEVEVTFADIGADVIELDTISVELDSMDNDVDNEDHSAELFTSTEAMAIANPLDSLGGIITGGDGADGASGASRNGQSGGAGQTSFFGTVAQGNSFVYILDVSPSMNARGGERLQRAVRELLQSLDQLNDEQHFYVVVFGWSTRLMFDGDQLVPRPIPATLKNKQRFRRWLAKVNTISGTDPRKSLDVSLGMKPSAVFFLSDGEFNKPGPNPFFADDDTEAEDVVTARGAAAVPIHTIAFEDPVCEPRMSEIAKMTNGQHRFVPAPEEASRSISTRLMRQAYIRTVREFVFSDEGGSTSRTSNVEGTVDDALASRAAYSLQLAKMLEDSDKHAMAQRFYERIVRDYPDTPAAKHAQMSADRLKAIVSE